MENQKFTYFNSHIGLVDNNFKSLEEVINQIVDLSPENDSYGCVYVDNICLLNYVIEKTESVKVYWFPVFNNC
jgi:hypothetical protein